MQRSDLVPLLPRVWGVVSFVWVLLCLLTAVLVHFSFPLECRSEYHVALLHNGVSFLRAVTSVTAKLHPAGL